VVTNADSLTMPEDCSNSPATSCATPVTVNVLANDTLGGGVVDPTAVTVAISTQAVNGTSTVVGNNIVYAPKPNYNGPDLVGYKVTITATGAVSAEGYLHITITPVNDAPTANNDTGGAPNNKPVTLNVLANDTDPDGAADLAAAVIVTVPTPAGATLTCNGGAAATVGTVCPGGLITFTPTAVNTYSFTYKAQDQAGALSANTANVSVTVNATESIVVQKSIFTNKTWRWTVAGTDSSPAGQTLTITYNITTPPTYKVNGVCTAMTAATNPVIGTATVDALGNWTYDTTVTSAGTVNPTNTGSNGTGFWCSPPKAVSITSPFGGTASSNISFK
jgi:cadherin-like protein